MANTSRLALTVNTRKVAPIAVSGGVASMRCPDGQPARLGERLRSQLDHARESPNLAGSSLNQNSVEDDYGRRNSASVNFGDRAFGGR